jgi:ABC-2 type transport system ATP-binding protein
VAGTRTVVLSTHIVDDIAQTCQHLTVLARGRAVFTGTTEQLAAVAHGQVWSLVTSGPPPATGTVAGIWHHDGAVHHRVVSDVSPTPDAQPAQPTLEDGYLALMANQEERC